MTPDCAKYMSLSTKPDYGYHLAQPTTAENFGPNNTRGCIISLSTEPDHGMVIILLSWKPLKTSAKLIARVVSYYCQPSLTNLQHFPKRKTCFDCMVGTTKLFGVSETDPIKIYVVILDILLKCGLSVNSFLHW